MAMKKLFIIWGLLVYSIGSIIGQPSCWITKKIQGDSVTLQGNLHNPSSNSILIDYRLSVTKAGPNGQSNNTQKGSFTATPNATIQLSTITLNTNDQDYYLAMLTVLQNGAVVAADTLLQGRPPASISKQTPARRSVPADAIEIDGLIIDDTRSKVARDFYEIFYNKWAAPFGAKDYSITIRELPSRGRSARIAVEVNNQQILQRFLQPRLDIIEALVDQSIYILHRHLNDNESLKSQMSQEDQKGSGLY